MRKFIFFLLLVVKVHFSFCQIVPTYRLNDSKDIQVPSIAYLKDSVGYTATEVLHLSMTTVEQDEFIARFEPENNYWIRLKLYNPTAEHNWLIDFGFWHKVIYYAIEENRISNTEETGFHHPYRKRPYKLDHRPLTKVMIPPNDTTEILLKVYFGENELLIPFEELKISVQEEAQLLQEHTQMLMRPYLYTGFYLALFLYNLFIYFSTRDRRYLLYLGTLIMVGITPINNTIHFVAALSFIESFTSHLGLFDVTLSFLLGSSIIFFTIDFLDLKHNIRGFYYFFLGVWGLIAFTVPLAYLGQVELANILISMLGLVTMLSTVIVAIMAVRRKVPSAKYFLLAYSFFALGCIILLSNNIIPLLPLALAAESISIGSLLETLLFSFALADRINVLRKKNQEQQEEVIEQLRINEELKEKVTRELENKVRIRTREIMQAQEELSTQNEELSQLNAQVSEQRDQLEIIRNNLTDSIKYARRIQRAILPTKKQLTNTFEYFIIFKPRDIVSGDFYWLSDRRKQDGSVFFAAVDCTGHGVPGAFMSMIANDSLNYIINEQRVTEPKKILELMNDAIASSLNQKENKNRDGMDMSLIRFIPKSGKLFFAGAKNPLCYYQHDALHIIKGSLYSIGGNQFLASAPEYTQQELQLTQATQIYLFSDGYQDQFGGSEGRKFMRRRFYRLLEEVATLSLPEQEQQLNKTLEDWQGNIEQLDDILVAGLLLKPEK